MRKERKVPRRLVRQIVRIFPTVTAERVSRNICQYRFERDNGRTDWEGERVRFKKIIKISFDARR